MLRRLVPCQGSWWRFGLAGSWAIQDREWVWSWWRSLVSYGLLTSQTYLHLPGWSGLRHKDVHKVERGNRECLSRCICFCVPSNDRERQAKNIDLVLFFPKNKPLSAHYFLNGAHHTLMTGRHTARKIFAEQARGVRNSYTSSCGLNGLESILRAGTACLGFWLACAHNLDHEVCINLPKFAWFIGSLPFFPTDLYLNLGLHKTLFR